MLEEKMQAPRIDRRPSRQDQICLRLRGAEVQTLTLKCSLCDVHQPQSGND